MSCTHEGMKRLIAGHGLPEGVSLRVSRGRFREEHNLVLIYLGSHHLLTAKSFCGRPPYRAWLELFDIDPLLFPRLEGAIYDWASAALGAAEPLYVEYLWDLETVMLLDRGAPPVLTRVGFELLRRGFTWFKVWYYPEGFMEGGAKLQAEKPLNEAQRRRNLEEVCSEARTFAERLTTAGAPGALRRVQQLSSICSSAAEKAL